MILKIDSEVAQEILNYLQERPFKEVFPLINKMVKLEKLDDDSMKASAGGSTNGAVPVAAEPNPAGAY